MKPSLIVALITCWSIFSCNNRSEKDFVQTHPEEPLPANEPVQIISRDQVVKEANALIENLDTVDMDIFETFTFEDIGYKLSVYAGNQLYSMYCYNDPIDKISCLFGMQHFVSEFGLSQHFSEDHMQYHLERKDNIYEILATSLNEPRISLDKLSKEEYIQKYTGKFGDPFTWITMQKEFMKKLDLKRAGANMDLGRYAFTMNNNSTLFYYSDGPLPGDAEDTINGTWLEENKYYLLFEVGYEQ